MTAHDRTKGIGSSFWAVLLLIFSSLIIILSPWPYGLVLPASYLTAELLISLLFLASLITLNNFMPATGTDQWMVGTVFLGIAYGLFSSVPYVSLFAFLKLVNAVFFYLMIRRLVRSQEAFHYFLWLVMIVGLGYAAYGLAQYYGYIPHVYWLKKTNLAARYVNGGHFALYLLFPIFSACALSLCQKAWWKRVLILLSLFVLCWTLLLTRSRTVWGASLAGFTLYFVLLQAGQSFRKRMLLWGAFFSALFLGGILLWKIGVLASAWQRLETTWTADFFSLFHRWSFWEGCVIAFAKRPVGWGIGTFSAIFPQFRVHSDRFFVDYAHNEFLQIMVDFGLPGLIFLIGFLFFYARRFLKKFWNTSTDDPTRRISAVFFALIVSLSVASLTEFGMRIYASSLIFVAYLALGEYLFEGRTSKKALNKNPAFISFAKACIVLFTLACAVLSARQLYAQVHFDRAVKLEKNLDWNQAGRDYQKAVSISPMTYEYFETLGNFYRKRSELSSDRQTKHQFRQQAIQAFEKGTQLQRYAAPSHYALAVLYEMEADVVQSRAHYEKAMQLYPQNAVYTSEFAYFSLKQGDLPKALELFETFQKISFKEGTRDLPCQVLKEVSLHTKKYEDLSRVISSRWDDHQCLAKMMGEAGEWENADKEFARAAQIFQKSMDYKAYVTYLGLDAAEFYAAHGQSKKALEIYQEAARRMPDELLYQKRIEEITAKMYPANPMPQS